MLKNNAFKVYIYLDPLFQGDDAMDDFIETGPLLLLAFYLDLPLCGGSLRLLAVEKRAWRTPSATPCLFLWACGLVGFKRKRAPTGVNRA